MKPEKINLLFSVLFLIYALCFALWLQNDRIFALKEHVISCIYFCILLTITASYNVMAYFCKNCCCYAIEAFGFLLFLVFQVVNITALILALMDYIDLMYFNDQFIFFQLSNFNFPLSVFALISTLFCYQKMYHQEMEENYRTTTSSKPMLLKFCSSDFIKCIKIYNYAILFTTLIFAAFIYKCSEIYFDFVNAHYFLLLPFVTAIFNLLAIKFKVKWLCIPVIAAWALFSFLLMWGVCVSVIDHVHFGMLTFNSFIFGSTLFLTYFINVFVGFATTLYIITDLNSLQYEVTNASNSNNDGKYELESFSTTATRYPRNQIEREESLKRTFHFIFEITVKKRGDC